MAPGYFRVPGSNPGCTVNPTSSQHAFWETASFGSGRRVPAARVGDRLEVQTPGLESRFGLDPAVAGTCSLIQLMSTLTPNNKIGTFL